MFIQSEANEVTCNIYYCMDEKRRYLIEKNNNKSSFAVLWCFCIEPAWIQLTVEITIIMNIVFVSNVSLRVREFRIY